MGRAIALTKRINLSEFSEGWEDCYVLMRPASYGEVQSFSKLDVDALSKEDQLSLELEMLKDHFVGGKIRVIDESGGTKLVEMEAEDLQASLAIAHKVFFEMLGVTLDPKDIQKTATSN